MVRNGRLSDLIFQSTLPLRGATRRGDTQHQRQGISIHAPLAGSDPNTVADAAKPKKFQSTLPLRGATSRLGSLRRRPYFNPRSPCGERRLWLPFLPSLLDFNPRSPCGERRPPRKHALRTA